jgi:IS30 family transposase
MRIGLNRALARYPAALRRTITYDNGTENTDHLQVNAVLGTKSYFCAPYHSWEKGTVENTIGLMRRWLPKKTDFATVSPRQVKTIERWINHRPRKCLNYKTPAETFRVCVALTG